MLSRCLTCQHKDAGSDDGPDPQCDKVQRTQSPFETMLAGFIRLGQQTFHRLYGKELVHADILRLDMTASLNANAMMFPLFYRRIKKKSTFAPPTSSDYIDTRSTNGCSPDRRHPVGKEEEEAEVAPA
jgi:hypothetical protein